MKTFAIKEKRSVPAIRRSQPSRFRYRGLQVKAQRAEIRHILRPTGAQTKLTIGQPDDRHEQEADRVADQVMAIPDPKLQRQPENEEEETLQTKLLTDQIMPLVQRQEAPHEQDEEEEALQAKPLADQITPLVQRQEEPAEEEEETAQAKGDGGPSTVSPVVESDLNSLRGDGQPLPVSTRAFFEPRFGADFSGVRVNTNSKAAEIAESINAKAFTKGRNIVFAAGQYHPGSFSGRKLMAHELTHVVQQARSNRPGVIQRRRVPAQADLSKLVSSGHYDLPAHRAGLARLISLAMAEMKPKQKRALRRAAWKASGKSLRTYYRMPKWKRNLLLAQAIYQSYRKLRLGDPGDTEKPATPRSNVKILHDKARGCMSKIFNGNAYDNSIREVFGSNARYIRDVKNRFRNAHAALGRIYLNNKILTDRSGYMKEVGLGGGATSSEMNLEPHIIDNPTVKSSIALTIHESLHAGNYNTIKDVPGAYNDGSKRFREVSEAKKLRNADHYTVIAWRELAKNDKRAHPRKTFTPVVRRIRRRTRIGAASLIAIKEGSKKAMQTLTSAVSNAMTLHDLFRNAYNTPGSWNLRISHRSVRRNARYSNTLPYWSKVEKLTTHMRPDISQYTSDPSRKPVSTTDLAISEGVVRRLNLTL